LKDNNRVGVHIATRNRPGYLGGLLSSLYIQTFKNFDVIIVDDYSQMPITSDKYCMDWIVKLRNEGHMVKTIRNPCRLMIGKSRNIAIDNDPNELCCRIDDDSFCEPDYLFKLQALITGKVHKISSKIPLEKDQEFIKKNNAKIGAVGGLVPYLARPRYYRYTKDLTKFETIKVDADGKFLPRTSQDANPTDRGHFSWYPDVVLESDHLRSSFMFRKQAAIDAGLHAEEYGSTGFREETDFCIRIKHAGYKLYADTSALCWHLLAAGGGERDHAGRSYQEMVKLNQEHFDKKMIPYLKELNTKNELG